MTTGWDEKILVVAPHADRFCPRCLACTRRNAKDDCAPCAVRRERERMRKSPQLRLTKSAYEKARYESRRARDPKGEWLHRNWLAVAVRAARSGTTCNRHALVCPDVCPVLGLLLNYGMKGKAGFASANSPSFDRIRPGGGYVEGNVRVISWRANSLRKNGTFEEWEAVYLDAKKLAGS